MAKYTKPTPAALLTDFYKVCHKAFFNPHTEQLVAYWTPRKSRLEHINYVVMFWLQALIKIYLIDRFDDTFFSRPWEEVYKEYVDYVSATFDSGFAEGEAEALHEIHKLGYLPIEIRAIPEGTRVPIGCPMIEFRCTDKCAFWLPEYLETICSCNLWPAMTDATIADVNRRELDKWYDKTVDDNVPHSMGAGDFSMRGMFGEYAAVMADAGHLLSFGSTATVPTGWWLHNMYQADISVGKGLPSLEHSVWESWGEENELEAFRHMLVNVRPKGALSMVSDTWNLWRVLEDYMPKLKDIIMGRDGKVVIRPDSGNPADILCGTDMFYVDIKADNINDKASVEAAARRYIVETAARGNDKDRHDRCDFRFQYGKWIVTGHGTVERDPASPVCGQVNNVTVQVREKTVEEMGVIEALWNVFGGQVNSKGYKVLDPHVGAIYGDAITYDRLKEIFSRLAAKGFASNNVVMGFGSYTYQYVTRDTFGFALKVTHGIIDGKEVAMFKDPITDRGSHSAGKKSQRGMCVVHKNGEGNDPATLSYTDGHTMAEADGDTANNLRLVFRNGELFIDEDFETIRKRLHPNF